MERKRIFAISGVKNSGKTTLICRLLEIFKNLREDFIPGTRTFIKGLQILSDGELKRDFETVIKIPGIKELKDERDRLLKESRTI